MALATSSGGYTDWGLACGFVDAHATITRYLDAVTWGRDTGNASRAWLAFTMNACLHYDSLVWAGSGSFGNNELRLWSNVETVYSGVKQFPKGGTYCYNTGTCSSGCCYQHCGGVDYWWNLTHGHWNGHVLTDASTSHLYFKGRYLDEDPGPDGDYTLPDNLRILPPVSLSVSFPTAITGNVSASISKWSNNTNIGGTPTSYPGASYWNWAIDLLDEYGNMVAHKTFNTGETKSCSFGAANSGWYTASALSGSSAANSSSYTIQAGKKYKMRVYAQNNMNQRLTADSGWYVSSPPKPTVSITSIVYDPATKKNKMCFDWSLATSGLTPEKVTYDITLPDGTSVSSGTLKTINDGSAASETKCVTGLPTGDLLKVTVTNTAGPTGNQMSESASDSMYAPVANAAFLGFDWDELRRTVVVRAEAPGAANCRIQAGNAPNNYNLGNKLTTGEVGTITLKDLPHGDGQALYLQAVPESSNGHQYTNEIAKVTVPVPNPILGVLTPGCDSPDEQRYIVDIIEKKANCAVTPKWQTGDRVVVKAPCP